MSAASIEAKAARRAVGSTDPETTGRHLVGTFPLLAEMLDVRFARLEHFRAALEMNWANTDPTAGTVTYFFEEGKGGSWTFASPTHLLNTETFETKEPFQTEGLITNI